MSDLKRLTEFCRASVSIVVNKHRDYYETVGEYMEERDIEGTDPEVIAKMIKTDNVVELHFYPRTPIGFHVIWHYDVDLALAKALSIMNS